MQLVQLLTFVGLALSHVRAAPPVIPDHDLQLVNQIVTLITRPDIVVKNTPEFKSFEGLASQSPFFFDRQLHQGAAETLSSLRSVGDDKTPYLFHSMMGYHSTTEPKRSEIYRNSIFSRIVDLVHANPAQSREHLISAYNSLLLSLKTQLVKLEEQHLAPMGDKKVIDQLEQLLARFNEENKDELHKFTQHILSQLPSNRHFTAPQYLSREEVNEALQATNSPKLPPAMLIDGFKSLSLQQAHAPHTHPNVALHKPQPVAAAA